MRIFGWMSPGEVRKTEEEARSQRQAAFDDIRDKALKIASLRTNLDTSEFGRREYAEALTRMNAEAKLMREKIDSQRLSLLEAEKHCRMCLDDVVHSSEARRLAEESRDAKTCELLELQDRFNTLQEDSARCIETYIWLKGEYLKAREQACAHENEASRLRRELAEVKPRSLGLHRECQRLKADLADADEEKNAWREETSALAAEVLRLNQSLDECAVEATAWLNRLSESEKDNAYLHLRNQDLVDRLLKLQDLTPASKTAKGRK